MKRACKNLVIAPSLLTHEELHLENGTNPGFALLGFHLDEVRCTALQWMIARSVQDTEFCASTSFLQG